jgi:arginine decarboxylase
MVWVSSKNSLAFEYDYQYMIDEIINQIKIACDEAEVDVPHIFTEFGSFTVRKRYIKSNK